MRSCTAFCAPLPSATIVMTAPTPMMMPSIVRNDRSLFARIAWSATWKISPCSTLGPRGRRLRARRGRLLLMLGWRQILTGHALLNCGADLRFAHAWRQLNRPAVRRRHRTPARAPCSGIAARGRVATGDATAQRRAIAVCGGLLLLLVGRELLLDIVGIETQYLRR